MPRKRRLMLSAWWIDREIREYPELDPSFSDESSRVREQMQTDRCL